MIRAEPASVGADAGLRVELLEQVVGGQLDLLVAPLRGAEHARDQAAPMEPPEVAEDERVPGLRLVGRAGGQPEVPRRVLLPGVTVEKPVLVGGGRLVGVPLAVEDVRAGGDQLARLRDGSAVQLVSGHRGDRGTVAGAPRSQDAAGRCRTRVRTLTALP